MPEPHAEGNIVKRDDNWNMPQDPEKAPGMCDSCTDDSMSLSSDEEASPICSPNISCEELPVTSPQTGDILTLAMIDTTKFDWRFFQKYYYDSDETEDSDDYILCDGYEEEDEEKKDGEKEDEEKKDGEEEDDEENKDGEEKGSITEL